MLSPTFHGIPERFDGQINESLALGESFLSAVDRGIILHDLLHVISDD